jgi:hypothetical protein
MEVQQLRFLADQIAAGLSPADAHRPLEERTIGGLPLQPEDGLSRNTLLILLAERDPYAAEFAEYFLRTEGS